MRRNIWMLLVALVVLMGQVVLAQGFNVKVISSEQGEVLPGANIRYGKTQGIATDLKGYAQLPIRVGLDTELEISFVGYHTLRTTLRAKTPQGNVYIIALHPDTHIEELLVTRERRATSINAVEARINAEDLRAQAGKSLADVLEQVSGVSSIKTGANTSKPVIHGMHGNRILIVNNGVRQSGQQWGEGHAPEVDFSSSGSVHVVKGAEGVRYGSEALGGIIVMEQRALPYHADHLSGGLSSSFNTNGQAVVGHAHLEGSVPRLRDLAWRVQALYANGGDKHTPNYTLNNTGERQMNLAASLGYHGQRFEVEAFYSLYDTKHGVLRSTQLGSRRIFDEIIAMGRPHPDNVTPYSRNIGYPYEHVTHHTLTGKATWSPRKLGQFMLQTSYQTDARREYRIRRTSSAVPEVDLSLYSLQTRLRWLYHSGYWHTEVGAQHQYTDNHNVPGNGVVPVIPNYAEVALGAYGIVRYGRERWGMEAGARLDQQAMSADGFDRLGRNYGGSRLFVSPSYSLGAHYNVTHDLSITSNLGVAWRAPHVYELYAAGSDHGSAAYVQGDSTLRSEQSFKWVTSVSYHNNWLNVSLDAYLQWIQGYIYDEPQISPDGSILLYPLISGHYPVFAYKQTNAYLRGADLHLELSPIRHLRYRLTTALIWANEQSTGAYLPFIAPMRIDHALNYQWQIGCTWHLSAEVGHRYVAKQRRFDPRHDLIPYTPGAYHLFSGSLTARYKLSRGHQLSLSLSGDNLFNHEYKEYTNRARYYSHDLGRDIRVQVAWTF